MQMDNNETTLWQRHRSGEKAAREALVERYLWLIPMVARQFRARLFLAPQDFTSTAVGMGEWNDGENSAYFGPLEQAGVIGLIEAVDKFDLDRSTNFASYAYLFIKGAILSSAEVTKNIPRRLGQSIRKLRQIEDEYVARKGEKPDDKVLAKLMKVKAQKVREYRQAAALFDISSLEEVFGKDEGEEHEIDIPDLLALTPEEILEEKQDQLLIQQLVRTLSGTLPDNEKLFSITHGAVIALSERQQKVLLLTFMSRLTAEEVASKLGITVGHMRVELSRAVKGLRDHFNSLNQEKVAHEQ